MGATLDTVWCYAKPHSTFRTQIGLVISADHGQQQQSNKDRLKVKVTVNNSYPERQMQSGYLQDLIRVESERNI